MDATMQYKLGEIDPAIESLTHMLSQTPDGDPNQRLLLTCLEKAHNARFDLLHYPNDIQKVIEYTNIILRSTPDDNSSTRNLLNTLGVAHGERFQLLGDMNDLQKDIEYTTRALRMTPDGDPQLPQQLANLATSLSNRFRQLGDLDDIDWAIEYNTQAVAATHKDNTKMSKRLAGLGSSHLYRYERLGELNDLEKAIDYGSQALAITPNNTLHLPNTLITLGNAHGSRFGRLGKLGDLEKAIEYQYQALGLTPDSHSRLPGCLENMGILLRLRFESLDRLDDLDKAIEYGSRAMSLTPDGHPDMPGRLANLAVAHKARFKRLENVNDLEKAIEYEARALSAIPANHPISCMLHFNHAVSYLGYYSHSANPSGSHLQELLNLFRKASTSLTGAPRIMFEHARDWASAASRIPPLDPIEAYQATINLLPQFVWLGATTAQRYEDLKITETLAVNAARAAIASADYSLALEWLEHTRCVVWKQSIMLRSPLDQLEASHPSFPARLKTVANELHSESLKSRELLTLSSDKEIQISEEANQRRHRLAKEYNELLVHIRTLPGLKDFLQPVKINALVHAAKHGPIVVINCHEDNCDALLVIPGQSAVTHLPLYGFNREKALRARSKIESSLKRLGFRERGVHQQREPGAKDEFSSVLSSIWDGIVRPVLDFMGYLSVVPTSNLPHVIWCPTGPVSFLPLHAAGDYGQPDWGSGSRAFNYVISSYTPTLTALLATTPSKLSCDSRVLAIGQPATPGRKPLPGATTELQLIKAHVGNKAGYSQLMDAQATPTTVLDAMEQHDWVHFACHAHQNVYDPTKSGFFLHGDTQDTAATLDLAAINGRSFKKKGLAFLSACQTATGDETLPDEAVHLASGMLMAGYSSIIATMWSVVDQDAPFVADKLYAQLMVDGKLGNGEAGRALHHAVAGLRKKVGEKEFGQWVPFIHIGS